jgi:hypothetical protein
MASGAKTARIPAAQAKTVSISPVTVCPAGNAACPSVSPRSALATVVIGWWSAKAASQPGMVLVGRNTELVSVSGKTIM